MGIQRVWTADVHEALSRMRSDRAIIGATNKTFVAMLSDLVAICLTDLGSKISRTKFDTSVTWGAAKNAAILLAIRFLIFLELLGYNFRHLGFPSAKSIFGTSTFEILRSTSIWGHFLVQIR